jgi:tRNA pseudouridine38-40 synthase
VYVCGLVAYDGSDFHGFQYQPAVPTIQGALEEALAKFAPKSGRVIGAGRTDSGVHASGQVIAVDVEWRHRAVDLERAWNVHLPDSIAIRQLQIAPTHFHPRFSGLARVYRYTVIETAEQTIRQFPLTDRFAITRPGPLELAAMNEAANYLVGEHDFATFGQPPSGESTIRRVDEAYWQVVESNLPALHRYPGQRLVFTIRANAFLYQMVRSLVGALLAVGQGLWTPADLLAALQAKRRSAALPPAPPCGLVLERIDYPAELGLQFA